MRSIGLINVMKEKLVILFLNIATALEPVDKLALMGLN